MTDQIETLEARVAELERERDEALARCEDLRAYEEVVNSAAACDAFDDAGDKWLAMFPIDRMIKAITSVFAKWSNDEIMGRFREKIRDIMHLAFVEGALVGQQAERSRAQAAEALAADLAGALEPFADIDGEGTDDYLDGNKMVLTCGRMTNYSLRLGHLRKASAALARWEERKRAAGGRSEAAPDGATEAQDQAGGEG